MLITTASPGVEPGVATSPDASASSSGNTRWRKARRWAVPVFAILVAGLLLSNAHKVDWSGAWEALHRYSWPTLVGVLALATASHALYGSFDLIGRHHTRHRLSAVQTWAIAVASYAFNLNLGALVGGVGMRIRLYTRAGLDEATIAQVVSVSYATNWMGYALLAGGLFASGVIRPPREAHLSVAAFHALGFALVAVALAYVVLCAWRQGREWHVRGRALRLPSWRIALLQLAMSVANWSLMGAAMYLLLGGKVDYTTTLAVLLAASIIGVVTPIPAGLGVLEAVYLALLSGQVKQGTLMGAILAYRALYYLLPLAGAACLYLALARHDARQGRPTEQAAEQATEQTTQ